MTRRLTFYILNGYFIQPGNFTFVLWTVDRRVVQTPTEVLRRRWQKTADRRGFATDHRCCDPHTRAAFDQGGIVNSPVRHWQVFAASMIGVLHFSN